MRRRVIAADVLDSRKNDWTITDDAVGYLNPPAVLSLNAGTPVEWQKAKRTRLRDDWAFGDDGIDRGPIDSWPAPVLRPRRPSDDRNPATYSANAKLTRSGLPDAYDFLRGKLDTPKLDYSAFPDEDTYPDVPTSDAMGIGAGAMSTFVNPPPGTRTEPLRPPDGIQQYRYVRRPLVSFEYDIPGVDRYQYADFAGLLNFMRRTDAGALDGWGGYTGAECRGLYHTLNLDDAGMPKSWYEVIDRTHDQMTAKLSAWGKLLPGDKKTLEDSFANLIAHATDDEKWNRFNATKALSFKLLDSVDSPIVSGGATAAQAVSKMMGAFGGKPKVDVGPIAAIVRAPMSPSHGAHVAEFEKMWKDLEAHVNAQGGLLSTLGKGIVSVGEGALSIGKGIASPVAALVTSPIKLASDIATGKNVFESLKDTVKRDLSSAKELAPYVQAAISVIPVGGQLVSGAISAGAALAQGQPITSALINGVKNALPGGPIASSAFDAAYAVARGQNVSEAALQALVNNAPGGELGKKAAQTAIAVAKGQNIQQAALSAAKGAALSLIPGATPAIVKDLATNVAEGQNVISAATSAVGKQAMASFSPVAKGVLDNTGPARIGTVLGQSLPTIIPTDMRMAAQALLQNPKLRSMPIEDVARHLGVSTHVVREGMGSVLQAVQKSGGTYVPSLSAAKDLAARIPVGMSFDQAMSSFGSRAAPKAYSHNAASQAGRAARLRRAGSVFYALGARGIDCGALDPSKMPTIRQGSTGEAVVQWQKILAVTADGKFGPNTHAATVAFQKKNGLAPDGIVGPKSWAAGLVTVITTAPPQTVPGTSIPISVPPPTTTAPIIASTMPTIREGSTGAPVVTWQNFLQIKADGIFGPQTKAATISFQTKNALVADGIVGPKTWEKAMSGTSVPTSPPSTPTGPVVISTPPISIPTPTGPISIPGTTFPIPTPTGPISIPTPTGPIVVAPPTPMPPNPPGQPPPPPPITTTPPGVPPVVMPPPPGTPPGKSSSGLLIAGAVVLGGLLLMGSGSSRKLI